jgi:hypothetical protein
MARFVVLEHDHPTLHWDFLLEQASALRAWRLAAPPECGQRVRATAIPDHRLAYLDYEGPVSGNRGNVKSWDRGVFTVLAWTADAIDVALAGERLQCVARLRRDAEADWWLAVTEDPPTGPRS